MSATFTIQVDTTAPAVSTEINAGDPSTDDTLVALATTSDADAYEMKVWGSIDPTDPITNGNYGETEGAAPWFSYDPSLMVRLAPGVGEKTLYVKVRDDVDNTSEAVSDSIQLGEAPVLEPEPVPVGLRQPPQRLPKKPRTQRRTIVTRTQVRPRTGYRLGVFQPGWTAAGIETSVAVGAGISSPSSLTAGVRYRHGAAILHQTPAQVVAQANVRLRQAEGEETEAALMAMGII